MTTFRTRVVRADGRAINVVQRRAHLWYCFTGCCCGRTERGYAAVPVDTFKDEWLRRKLRNVVHLTKAGCLGPCALANVASLVFDGRAVWFHSVNTPWHVRLIYDYIETMVGADRFVAPPSELTEYVFNYYDWDVRPRHDAVTRRRLQEMSPQASTSLSCRTPTPISWRSSACNRRCRPTCMSSACRCCVSRPKSNCRWCSTVPSPRRVCSCCGCMASSTAWQDSRACAPGQSSDRHRWWW